MESIDFNTQLGKRLATLRKTAQLSQEQLAHRIETASSTVSRIERGQAFRTSLLPEIAKALGIDVGEIFRGL